VSSVPRAIADAFDPERFRADGHRTIDALADALARWHARRGPVVPWRAPAEAREAWPISRGELVDDLQGIVAASTALANPRCMAHQVPPPLPAAALAELVSALLNNGMAVYEMGPAAVPIELAVIEWMCGKLGLPASAGGVMTSGGSLGNLTALLAMRNARAVAIDKPAVIVSTDAHYSIDRALRAIGIDAIVAPVDERHRLTTTAVSRVLEPRVIGIVAAAGSTATGAFDPLDELADIAAARGLWLHVDGAHGASVALSSRHAGKLRGIARADSIVWDAHKLMMMPGLVTAVLYRDGARAYDAFAQHAPYLFRDDRDAWWDLGTRTLECTKRMMAIEVWTALRACGEAWFGDVVDRQIELANELAARVAAAPDFELALPPEANIVCYRHIAPGVDIDAHNRALRERVARDGTFYVVGTQLPRGYFLRSTIMNPLIETSDLDALLEHLRKLCRE
jgi:L-2,4-diaminobutyrate decarboxylase